MVVAVTILFIDHVKVDFVVTSKRIVSQDDGRHRKIKIKISRYVRSSRLWHRCGTILFNDHT